MLTRSDTPPTASSTAARSWEELFELIDYCRAGRLKEVSGWIAAAKPLDPPLNVKRSRRRSPLEIAIEKGFFALVELLLDGGCDPLANGNALCHAVRREEPGIAKLLLDRGVAAESVHPSDVLSGGRTMVELFIGRGFDPTADQAYYEALRATVHPLIFVLKEFKDRFPDLQRQAEMALCYHVEKASPRNIGLLLWAGARADGQVPDPNYVDDGSTASALAVAVRQGRTDILKQLKPQNFPDVLSTFFREAWLRPSKEMFDYLLSLGAPLNNKANGGSEVIEHLLWSLAWESKGGVYGYANPSRLSETMALLEHLCRAGAKWVPDANESVRHTRDRFRKLAPETIRNLFRLLRETDSASVELLDSVVASPALRKSLGAHLRSIEEVLHPPAPKKPADPSDEAAPLKKGKEKPAPPSVAELRDRAEQLLLEIVRQEPSLHFTRNSTGSYCDKPKLRKRLGMQKDDERDIQPIIHDAVAKLNRRLTAFQVTAESNGRTSCRLEATLNKGFEWSAALEEAWAPAERQNESFLTDVALDLRKLVLSGELGPDWHTERSISFKIGLHGREHVVEPYLQEIENKTGIALTWEGEKNRWPEPRRIRISVGETSAPAVRAGVNPKIDIPFDVDRKQDRDSVQRRLYDDVLNARLEENTPFFFITISTREELDNCLPRFSSSDKVAQFFHELPIHSTLRRSFDFRAGAKCWFVAFIPADNWGASLRAIEEEISRPSVAQQYGVSEDAAKLLEWIEALPKERYTGPWTPIVEEAAQRWIGIQCPWGEENFPAYLQMLVEQLNDRTDYDISVQPWRQHSATKSRLRVRRRRTELDDLASRLQVLGLQRGVVVDIEVARAELEKLLNPER